MSYYRYRSYSPYWDKIHSYLTRCAECGGNTSKKYARANGGFCKKCVVKGVKPDPFAAFKAVRSDERDTSNPKANVWYSREQAERDAMMYDADYNDGETYDDERMAA